MRRALTAEHVYGLIVSSYQTEAEALRQHLAGTNKNCMQGWLLAAMEAVTLAAEIATKTALPVYAARDAERHDWIREYCRPQVERFRQRVNLGYSGSYLQLVRHSAAGWRELKRQTALKKRIDVDKVYGSAIAGKGLTEELFKGLEQKHMNWKHIDPNALRLGLIVVTGVPVVIATKRCTGELLAAQCPALLRYAAQAIVGTATGFRPDRNAERLLYAQDEVK